MENKQTAPAKPGTMSAQKTNEDFNKKQPDPKDPNQVKAETTPEVEVPDISIRKEEKPDDLTMIKDENQPDEVKNPEIHDEDAAEDVEDTTAGEEGKDLDSEAQENERTNKVTM